MRGISRKKLLIDDSATELPSMAARSSLSMSTAACSSTSCLPTAAMTPTRISGTWSCSSSGLEKFLYTNQRRALGWSVVVVNLVRRFSERFGI